MGTPRVLVIKSKHEDEYYVCSSNLEFSAVALAVLRERYEAGWYSTSAEIHREIETETLKAASKAFASYGGPLSTDEVQSLPEKLREAYLESDEKYRLEESRLKADAFEDLQFAETLEKLLAMEPEEAVQRRIGRSYEAWILFMSRGHYEYEGFDIENPLEPDELAIARRILAEKAAAKVAADATPSDFGEI